MTRVYTINQQILSIFKGVALFLFLTFGIFILANKCLASTTLEIENIDIDIEQVVWSTSQPSHLIPAPEITNIKQDSIISELKPYIKGKVLNFHKVEVFLDHTSMGQAQVKQGLHGWAEFYFKFDQNIDLGKHTIYTVAENINRIRSLKSDPLTFSVEHPFPSPTLYQPKNGQNQIKGVAWNNSILKIYVDEDLENQTELGEHASSVVGFSYKIIKSLQPGYHVVWVVAEDNISHKTSQKSNQIIIYTPGSKSANIKQELNSTKTQVPSPTITVPQHNQVIDDPKPHIGGLVRNDHLVKTFVDDQQDSSFAPIVHESGTTSFSQQISQELGFGLHTVYTQAVGLRGQVSGKSNIVKFIVTPELYHQKVAEIKPEEFTQAQPQITEKEPKIDKGVSIVELPKEEEKVKIIDEVTDNKEDQVGVVDEQEPGEITIEDHDVEAPLVGVQPEEGATPSESESKKEDWINIGFIVIGIILVILIVWWVILERKEMKEEEGRQKQEQGKPENTQPTTTDDSTASGVQSEEKKSDDSMESRN